MRVIVCGSRDGIDGALVRRTLAEVHSWGAITTVVHGAASGVDSAAAEWASWMQIDQEEHPADWKALGRRAGPIRNEIMAKSGAAMCIAIHRGTPGTRDMMRRARTHGIPVHEVRV